MVTSMMAMQTRVLELMMVAEPENDYFVNIDNIIRSFVASISQQHSSLTHAMLTQQSDCCYLRIR